MNKKLHLEFMDEIGETTKIIVDDPADNLDEATVMAQMHALIQANVFNNKGQDLAVPNKAYIIETVRTDLV